MGSLGAAQNTAGGAAEIEQLQVKRDGSDVTIQVVLTGAVKPTVETAINPDRLVLVLPGTISDAKQKHFPLDANGVRAVRLGLNNANPPVTRVVVDLDSAHPYTLSSDGKSITLRVQPTENAEVVVRHVGPAPAASAPLIGVFRRKPQSPATDYSTAQAPIPVPPKFPPINFPEKQAAAPAQTTTTASTAPSAARPKLGSLQQGTVFPHGYTGSRKRAVGADHHRQRCRGRYKAEFRTCGKNHSVLTRSGIRHGSELDERQRRAGAARELGYRYERDAGCSTCRQSYRRRHRSQRKGCTGARTVGTDEHSTQFGGLAQYHCQGAVGHGVIAGACPCASGCDEPDGTIHAC
jgi:hypothetical protein